MLTGSLLSFLNQGGHLVRALASIIRSFDRSQDNLRVIGVLSLIFDIFPRGLEQASQIADGNVHHAVRLC